MTTTTQTERGFSSLQTGDILLFKGNTWYDRAIEYLGRSPYSHVAICLKDPTWIRADLHGYYILESSIETSPDVDGVVKFGVQIMSLAQIILDNPGMDIYVRHLEECNRDGHFNDTIAQVYTQHKNDPYDCSIMDWLEAKTLVDTGSVSWTERLFSCNDPRKTKTFICSALCAYVFNRLGLLEDQQNVPWSIISPREWSAMGDQVLRFRDCVLKPETQLFIRF